MAEPGAYHIPLYYRIFLLYLEPISTIVGAVYAHFLPLIYLELTDAASAPRTADTIPLGTRIVLSQLANLYWAFTLNEALVLRSTNDIRVWRTLILGLLIADFGHLYSVSPHGLEQYYQFWNWNAIDCGNLGVVYLGAATRICFLAGVGITRRQKKAVKSR